MSSTLPPLHTLAILMAIVVMYHDLHERRAPNAVLFATLAIAGLWQLTVLLGWVQDSNVSLFASCMTLALGVVAMLPFYALGWMGAGDVKMMGVLGFLLGWKGLLVVWLVANALVATQTILIFAGRMAMKRQPQLALLQANWQHSNLYQTIQRPRQGRQGMPFAAYLGIGVFVYVFCSPLPGVLS